MIPKNLIHIAQRLDLRDHRIHPPDHTLLIKSTPLSRIARRRQLRQPEALVRPRVVQRRDLVERARGILAVDVRGNDIDLVHATIARGLEAREPVAGRDGRGRGHHFRGSFEGHEGLHRCPGVFGGGEGREPVVGVVGFVEELHVRWGRGAGQGGFGVVDFGGVHADGDLGCLHGVWQRAGCVDGSDGEGREREGDEA